MRHRHLHPNTIWKPNRAESAANSSFPVTWCTSFPVTGHNFPRALVNPIFRSGNNPLRRSKMHRPNLLSTAPGKPPPGH